MTKLVVIMAIVATFALSCSADEFYLEVKKAVVKIPNNSGCGGWCLRVAVIDRNGNLCRSQTQPSDCGGFNQGTTQYVYFNKQCVVDPYHHISFRLETPSTSAGAPWCAGDIEFRTAQIELNDYSGINYNTDVTYYASLHGKTVSDGKTHKTSRTSPQWVEDLILQKSG